MTRREVVEYLEETLFPRELRSYIAITCPNCKNMGNVDGRVCPICQGERFIVPKEFIQHTKEGGY
jgi:DnaJ-class molecular chaperone